MGPGWPAQLLRPAGHMYLNLTSTQEKPGLSKGVPGRPSQGPCANRVAIGGPWLVHCIQGCFDPPPSPGLIEKHIKSLLWLGHQGLERAWGSGFHPREKLAVPTASLQVHKTPSLPRGECGQALWPSLGEASINWGPVQQGSVSPWSFCEVHLQAGRR